MGVRGKRLTKKQEAMLEALRQAAAKADAGLPGGKSYSPNLPLWLIEGIKSRQGPFALDVVSARLLLPAAHMTWATGGMQGPQPTELLIGKALRQIGSTGFWCGKRKAWLLPTRSLEDAGPRGGEYWDRRIAHAIRTGDYQGEPAPLYERSPANKALRQAKYYAPDEALGKAMYGKKEPPAPPASEEITVPW